MRNVYVVGAYIPNGGTFMAYHVGLIASKYIDGEPIAIQVGDEHPDSSLFEYPEKLPMTTLGEFKMRGKSSDILVMNPSFSDLWLGPGFRGHKLMYVQDTKTFSVLDRWFDNYVSVSGHVCGFLRCVYGLKTPIIPPFVDLTTLAPFLRWEERPDDRVLVLTKGNATQQTILFKKIEQHISRNRPDVKFDFVPMRMKHREFLAFLAGYRYVLSLSCLEGFGLMPLESMGVGAAVVAFDAGGGQSYMEDEKNCWCARYPNTELLGDRLLHALNNPAEALKVSLNGIRQASLFTYERFSSSWLSHIRATLELT